LGGALFHALPTDGRLVWSQERLWKRTVIALDHEGVAEPAPDEAVLASRRLFANHYFEASLTVTAVYEASGASYVVFLHRMRSDKEGGGFNRFERALAGLLIRRRLRAQWQDVRARVESSGGLSRRGSAPEGPEGVRLLR